LLASPTLLTVYPDGSGPFVSWLESLGLKEFLKTYPLSKLVEWGWVVPQYRVVFPQEVFVQIYGRYGDQVQIPPELNDYATLWDYGWHTDDEHAKLWFLDDAFREHEPLGALLKTFSNEDGILSLPEPVDTEDAGPVRPYIDYFYRWQGYALVDLVRASDCIMPIYHTPDIVDRAIGIMRIAEHCRQDETDWPQGLLTSPNQWRGREKLMTALDHFRSFRLALGATHDQESPEFSRLYKQGARELAEHFGFTATNIASEVKDRLLTLADSWMTANKQIDGRAHWTQLAWPKLRADIQLAIGWLLAIGEKSFMDYVDEWEKPYFGNVGWAPLDEVLPYEFLAHQKKFVQMAPHYLKPFNAVCGKYKKITDEKIVAQCRHLQRTNSSFASFASSFFDLHEELRYKSFDEAGIDFRTLRPLDHYAMLAIRAESCLREELRRLGLLDTIPSQKQTLVSYIEILANQRGVSSRIRGTFMTKRELADLKDDRVDPVGRIQMLETTLGECDRMLVQAFLCSTLARNYFAHHDFLDHELLHSSKSKFLMQGILLTVLTLLNDEASGRT
jgi:hypothetical protein